MAALKSRVELSLDTVGATTRKGVDPVESCDGKFVPGHVSGDCGAGGPAWVNRVGGLHRLWTAIQKPRRSV